jgi:hypothetical protein
MFLYKINRKCYRSLNQLKLSLFAQMIFPKVFEVAKYADVAAQAANLKEKSLAFELSLIAAADGGKELTKKKNLAKTALIAAFDLLSNALEIYCNGEERYILDTGLSLKEKSVVQREGNQTPMRPINIFARSTGEVGEIELTLTLPNKEHVVTTAVEHRPFEAGASFTNGNYVEGEHGKIRNLTASGMVEFRFNSIGRDGLKSGWTTPVIVPVL